MSQCVVGAEVFCSTRVKLPLKCKSYEVMNRSLLAHPHQCNQTLEGLRHGVIFEVLHVQLHLQTTEIV